MINKNVNGMAPNILVRGCFKEMFNFWTKKLGMFATWGNENTPYASFSFNEGEQSFLAIFKAEYMNFYPNYEQPTCNCNPDKIMAVIYLKENTIHEYYEILKNNGIIFLSEPKFIEQWGGMWALYFRDPDGNLFGIYEGHM